MAKKMLDISSVNHFIFQLDSAKKHCSWIYLHVIKDSEIFLVENKLIMILTIAIASSLLCWYPSSHYYTVLHLRGKFSNEGRIWSYCFLYAVSNSLLCVLRALYKETSIPQMWLFKWVGLFRKVLGCVSLAKWVKSRKSPCLVFKPLKCRLPQNI